MVGAAIIEPPYTSKRVMVVVDPLGIAVGLVVSCGGAWLIIDRQRTASWIWERFNATPDPKWRPNWLPWHLRPTIGQANGLAWIFALCVLAFGLVMLGAGAGIR